MPCSQDYSIQVEGLPLDVTEDSLRLFFEGLCSERESLAAEAENDQHVAFVSVYRDHRVFLEQLVRCVFVGYLTHTYFETRTRARTGGIPPAHPTGHGAVFLGAHRSME